MTRRIIDRFEVKSGFFGGQSLLYACPQCAANLSSKLNEAGNADTCPDCGIEFTVPGVEERDRLRREQAEVVRKKREQKEQEELKRLERRRKEEEAQSRRAAALATHIAQQPPKPAPDSSVPTNDDPIRCPKCKSSQLTANKKGFSLGNAAGGAILLGPVGLLGGLIGGGQIRITCLKCGNVFEPGQGR